MTNDEFWPDTVRLRDTGIYDNDGGLGQRIYTTAGAGYKKVDYVRIDAAMRLDAVRQLAEQRAELLGAMNRAFDLIASIGYPANTSGRYDKSGKWTFDEAIPDHTNASAIESAFDVIADAIANATQQRNDTGGER